MSVSWNAASTTQQPATTETTDVSQFEGDLKVAGEVRGEVGIHLEDVEQIITVNLVQVTVGQRPDVARRLANRLMDAHMLAEHVILACPVYKQGK